MGLASRLRLLVTLGCALFGAVCQAQSFDCGKAQTPIEKAICASPSLIAQDTALASSYRQAQTTFGGDPAKLNDLRQQQRRWLVDRNKSCVQGDQAGLSSCLTGMYKARLAALGEANAPTNDTAAPDQATPPAASQAQVPSTPTATDGAALTAPASTQPASASLPLLPVVQPHLSQDRLPADQDANILLNVDEPGHITIGAESRSGVALQLVDMITGPGERMGVPGVSDGRIDALLDKGTYRLRVFGAKGATGDVQLTARADQELEQPTAALRPAAPVHADLSDLQQRSYWIDIPASGEVDIEAVGRSLLDLRLWRNGTDIADVMPEISTFELKPGVAMTRAILTGTVEPGHYRVTAYGGQKLVWSNSDAAEPFHIRTGTDRSLAAGIAEGVIGPFGSIRFQAPADLDTFRLELPQSAPAMLSAGRVSVTPAGFRTATIAQSSREPVATVVVAAADQASLVEVSGYEGQRFQLRGLRFSNSTEFDGSVPNLFSLDVAGEGADEIPATSLLLREDATGKATIVASDVPHLGPGQVWRRRFNLRGPTSLLFEMTQPGPISVHASGVGVHTDISPIFVGNAPRADGHDPERFDLNAGYYLLRLTPEKDAAGIIDLAFGTPGITVPVQPAAPARTTISFGVRQAEQAIRYEVITNAAPGLLTGPRAVALPADLQARPLGLWQPADAASGPEPTQNQPATNMPAPHTKGAAANGNTQARPASPADLRIDVRVPIGGSITAVDMGNRPIAFDSSNQRVAADGRTRTLTLHFPAPTAARAILVSWQPDPAAVATIVPVAPLTPLIGGQRQFLDLAENAQTSYRLELATGGLYRVETLGRLQTSLSLGTSLLPALADASDNGDGHNALLQTYLRAGSYQLSVSAQNSAGHLGLAVTPAPLLTVPALVSDGTSRGSLSAGRGVIVPIDIAAAGSYQLDLYSLGGDLTARLEDEDGWPLTTPGPLSTLHQDFTPGHYRLVILPREVDTRFVARLRPVIDPPQLQGHGPHPLSFNQSQAFQWREPQGRSDARVPDSWTFDLHAEADVSIDLSDGMIGTLVRNDNEQVARFVGSPQFRGQLKAGHYRIDLVSLARDDRVDYQLAVNTEQLQPGEARFATLPATLHFNVENDRVVSLGTLGRSEIKGILKDANGNVLERLSGRSDDWNIALSTRLAAGSYTLLLDQAASSNQGGGDTTAADNADSQDADSADDAQATAADDQANGSENGHDIEVRLALPREEPQPTLSENAVAKVSGAAVFTFPLPADVKDQLTLVAARSASDIVLSVETQASNGTWTPQATARGTAPVIAWPGSGTNAKWRASAWTLDGSAAPIEIASRSVARTPREPGDVSLEPLAVDGLDLPLNIALAHAPSAGLVTIDATGDLLAGATADHPLTTATSGLFAPQTDRLWLISRTASQATVTPAQPTGEVALTLAPGDRATIPAAPPAAGKIRLWRADSTFGQPGLSAGRGMGVGLNSAVTLAGDGDLHVWNAADNQSLQLRLKPIDTARLDTKELKSSYASTIPALSAQPLTLGSGEKRLALDLAPGITAVSAPTTAEQVNAWSGAAPLSRSIVTSAGEIWLVNLTGDAASARIGQSPGEAVTLRSDQVRRRFFGTAGSEEIAVDAAAGDILNVSGGDGTYIGADGRIARGERIVVSGPGRLIVDHRAGLTAMWLDHAGQSPWPKPDPQSVTLPQRVTLTGEAMSFRLDPKQPMVLDASTDAPVIIALEQNGDRDLELFPTGAELHRYLAAGAATLTLYSTHDGPLSGTLNLSTTPVVAAIDGVGAPVVLAPGTTALFGFEVKTSGNIGVGLRSDPDRVVGRLLDAKGQVLGEGVNQLKQLAAGSYLLEARAPADAPTLIVRPAIVGLSPPPAGPPPDVIDTYLQRAGLKPTGSK